MAAKYRTAHRGHLIYLFALPLLPAFFSVLSQGEMMRVAIYGGCIAGFALAAFLVSIGVTQQAKVSASRYRRVLTSGWVGLGGLVAALSCFVCQFSVVQNSFAMACTVAVIALIGIWLSYGVIRTDVEVGGASGYTAKEIVSHLSQAEDQLHAISTIKNQLEPGDIQQRLTRILRKSGNVLRQIETDPGDLRRARKFLSVFLPGTRDVCETYWKVHQSGSTDRFERRFRSTLSSVEKLIEQQIQKLKDNEEFDLDVQMEVLKTQINEEI